MYIYLLLLLLLLILYSEKCVSPWVQSAGFSLKMQPRLLLLPIYSHGLTTATVSSWEHLVLSSNLSRKSKTLLQDSFSWHPATNTNTSVLEKLHCLPISERIKDKVGCMCFNAINGSGPAYLWTATGLHSVSYTTLFFWHPHAENPTIQTRDSWLSHFILLWTPHLEFTPTRPLCSTPSSFKAKLKTFLFSQYFRPN